MRGKKIIFLSLALLLPVAIFLFLKFFGKNQFNVPPLHQDSVLNAGNCAIDYQAPYLLPDSVMEFLRSGSSVPLYLLNFSTDKTVLQRVRDEAGENEEVKFISESFLQATFPDQVFLKNCILLLNPADNLVLVDDQSRIRGYYRSSDREEIDRLLVEISIILKKY